MYKFARMDISSEDWICLSPRRNDFTVPLLWLDMVSFGISPSSPTSLKFDESDQDISQKLYMSERYFSFFKSFFTFINSAILLLIN